MNSRIKGTLSAAFVGTYPPRKCGIGTFTYDLVQHLKQLHKEDTLRGESFHVVALNNIPQGYNYPSEVDFEIREQHKSDYRQAAEFINLSPVDAISLQHEFGIFGGKDGSNIIHLLNNLKKPVVTTLRTALANPSPSQKEISKIVTSLSTLVVVLANKAIEILRLVYEVPHEKILMIPHGAPDVPFLDTSYYKDQFQAEDRRVLLTFGLLSPNKGIEYAIDII